MPFQNIALSKPQLTKGALSGKEVNRKWGNSCMK